MTTPEQDRWESCPQGTLSRTVHEIRARQLYRRRVKIAGLTSSFAALLITVAVISQQLGPTPVAPTIMGPISCATLRSLLPAYIAQELDTAVTGQVKTHLDRCPHCRDHYKQEKDETVLPGQRTSDSPQLAMRN
jgi:hypothetical protein